MNKAVPDYLPAEGLKLDRTGYWLNKAGPDWLLAEGLKLDQTGYKMKNNAGLETTIEIPTVCVVLDGCPDTLDTIYNSMCNNTPCVIVEGSGRVANIISEVANLGSSKITISLIKEKLQNYFQESYDTFTETQIITWTKKIQDIVSMGSLLTILREQKDRGQGMDVAILQAVLRASHSDDGGQENWDLQLKLAVSWNRADIAETQLFSDDRTWKPADLYPSLMVSLIEDKPAFVHLFLDHGVCLSEFLTTERLLCLYNNTDPSNLIHIKLQRLATAEGSSDIAQSTIGLHHVSSFLQGLLGQYIEPLYPGAPYRRTWSLFHENMRMNDIVDVMNGDPKHLKYPVRDLLIWCIVQHRAELSEIFWNLTQDSIAGALLCTKILRAMAKEEEGMANTEKMTSLSDVYEKRAVGVFSECYSNDKKQGENLLTHVSAEWGNVTIIDLAQEAGAQSFMSHAGVQLFLTKIWWGWLSANNSVLQVLPCMFLFPLIYSGLLTYRKGVGTSVSCTAETQCEQEAMGVRCDQRNDLCGNIESVLCRPRPYSCLWKIMAFFNAPIIKFYYNYLSYVGFLVLFAYVLIVDFQTYPSWREYLLYAWVITLLCEELRQLFYDPAQYGFVKNSFRYITDFWNQMEVLALCLFAVGVICRLVRTDTVYLGRVFLSVDYMIFCTRLLRVFTVSNIIGPYVVIFRRMLREIYFFLFILVLLIVAYGVPKQAILYINETRWDWIFRHVFYTSFLTLINKIPVDVDELNFKPSKCTQNGSVASLSLCIYNDGNGNALFPEWLTIILLCLFLMLGTTYLMHVFTSIIG
ncbi:transient receptor potential cation channel subfamily M member 2-like [Pseudophryne corroboree]|uniref:transient receptor potential cation channel subfamily M member 2-like n=1 Tax=Pseudophryne corroboree TaxID=495146 RepID=UPI00308193A0